MKITQVLKEAAQISAAFAFGRFNPAHQGHIAVWRTVQDAAAKWYIGTNPSTLGPNDPLTFEQKSAWMAEIYPPITGHIAAEQSVMTLAAKIFTDLGKNEAASIAYITDADDWAWSGKLLNQYNGVEGKHGYYKFAEIVHVPSPRVSSATALRDAARADDKVAFYHASGTDPKLKVAGLTYFDTVKQAVTKYPLPVKKAKKVAEGSIEQRIAQAKKNNPLRASVAKKTNGYAALVTDTTTGKPSWFGGALWQTPELAMGHAKAFVKGFPYLEQEYAQRFIDKNRNGIVGQGVAETINTAVLNKRFRHTQEIGDYTYKASSEYEESHDKVFLYIRAYDGTKQIGETMFEIWDFDDEPSIDHLESGGTEVDPAYRNKGIASTMYAYAKMLGNDIRPSDNQRPDGKAMWAAWQKSGAAKHLTGVAEGAPIVVAQAPIDVRNPKKAAQPYRNQGDIVPPTQPPSTEKRGVKGRAGQRPMPTYEDNVEEASLATMRDYFAGDENAKDPTKLSQMRDFFNKHKPEGRVVDKHFNSKSSYEAWLRQQKMKKIGEDDEAGEVESKFTDYERAVMEGGHSLPEAEKIAGRYDPVDFDSMVQRLGKITKAGPVKTVWDPEKRVYKTVPDTDKQKKIAEAVIKVVEVIKQRKGLWKNK